MINIKCERIDYIAHGQTKSTTLQKRGKGKKKCGQVNTASNQETLMAYLEPRKETPLCRNRGRNPLFQTGPCRATIRKQHLNRRETVKPMATSRWLTPPWLSQFLPLRSPAGVASGTSRTNAQTPGRTEG